MASLKISEEIGDTRAMANSYIKIGDIYFEQDIYIEALNKNAAALKIFEELGEK